MAAHRELMAEGFTFGLGQQTGLPWPEYLRLLRDYRLGANLPSGHVPSTFLVADVGGTIVGRVSIRHELNEYLAREGGHIGYAVLAARRRHGYATEMLRQSLVIIRALGIADVLITCDDDNTGSIKVIESCGGQLDSVISVGGSNRAVRRYWIR